MLALKSTFHGSAHIDLTKLVVDEITVVGSRCGPFLPALRLLEANAQAGGGLRAGSGIQVRPLIDGEYSLRHGLAAFEHAAQPGARKILLRPD
jgi:hypothetical protein